MEMLFLSEYRGDTRTAQVFHRRDRGDYATVCYYSNKLDQQAHYFSTESDADDFAEDWVLVADTN